MRNPYIDPLARFLGFLAVAIPLGLLLLVVIGFRALAMASSGTNWAVALLQSTVSFVCIFGVWYVFARVQRMRGASQGKRSRRHEDAQP